MGSGLIRHLALSLFGATTGRAIIFIMLPLAARIYSKEDFGGLALVVGFVGLVQPLLTLRYEIAIVLPRSDAVARAVVRGLFGIAAAGYGLAAILVAVAPDILAPIADPNLIRDLRAPVLVHLAATVVTVALTAWLQRKGQFRFVALSQMLGALVTAIIVLGAPLFISPNLVVLFAGYAAGAATSAAVVVFGASGSRFFEHWQTRNFRRTSSIMMKYRVYPMFSLPLSLSALAADRVLLLYLSAAFSLAALGGFFSIRQLLFGLVHLVTATISQVIYAYAARSGRKVASLRAPLLTLASGIAVSAGFALGWTSINSLELTRVLLGPAWLDTAPLVPWIAAHGAVAAVVGWQGRLLDVEGRQRLDAGLQMAGDAAVLIVVAGLWVSSAPEILAVAIICLVGVLHGTAWIIIVYRITNIGAKTAIGVLAKLALAGVASAACAFGARVMLDPVSAALLSLCLTSIAIFVAVALSVRRLDGQVKGTGVVSLL